MRHGVQERTGTCDGHVGHRLALCGLQAAAGFRVLCELLDVAVVAGDERLLEGAQFPHFLGQLLLSGVFGYRPYPVAGDGVFVDMQLGGQG